APPHGIAEVTEPRLRGLGLGARRALPCQQSLALFLRPPAFGHVHDRADELDEIAGGAEHRMADGVDTLHRSVRKNDAVVHLEVHPLTGRRRYDVANDPSVR